MVTLNGKLCILYPIPWSYRLYFLCNPMRKQINAQTPLYLHTVSQAGSDITGPAALLTIHWYLPSSAFVTVEIISEIDVAPTILVLFFCH